MDEIKQTGTLVLFLDTKGSSGNVLIFHKYGERYFLSGVRVAGNPTAYELPEGKAEAELRAQKYAGFRRDLAGPVAVVTDRKHERVRSSERSWLRSRHSKLPKDC